MGDPVAGVSRGRTQISVIILSPQQETILREVAEGKTYRQIADGYNLSEQTVKNHVYDATRRNNLSKIQLVVAVVTGETILRGRTGRRSLRKVRDPEGIRVRPPTPKPKTGCTFCDRGAVWDDGYHEVPDAGSVGGMRWVPCESSGGG